MNDLHTLQKKLQFKSSHRGSKEMDILLGSFVEKYIKLFNEGELQMLEAILELDDNDIYRYALDKVTIPKEIDNRVMQLLKDFTCLLYTSPSPRDKRQSRMPSSA